MQFPHNLQYTPENKVLPKAYNIIAETPLALVLRVCLLPPPPAQVICFHHSYSFYFQIIIMERLHFGSFVNKV